MGFDYLELTEVTMTDEMREILPPTPDGAVVALLIRDFRGGGAERSMITIANGLAAKGIEVDLLALKEAGFFRGFVSPKVRVVELDTADKGLLTVLSVGKLIRYLRQRRPHKVITTLEALNVVVSIAGVLTRRSKDIVIRVATTYDREVRPPIRAFLIRALYRWHPGSFVANSLGSAQNLSAALGIDTSRVGVIYNAVDIDAIDQLKEQEPEHGSVNHNRPFVLFVGRLAPAKRIDVLLRAFARVRRDDLSLVLLGEGPMRPALTDLIAELGLQDRVRMPGFTTNPYAYMSRAAALVLSSDYEGMPTVLIEALACGCPVVSTDCLSGPREVLEGGKWGTLVPIGDAPALAAAIEQTLEHPLPSSDLQERAQSFSEPRAAASYLDVLFPEPGVRVREAKALNRFL